MRIPSKSVFAGFERDAWVRFIVAIGGLGLAFAAALFSSVAREEGNVWATALLASSALLMAGLVAVTTVPYLARRVAVRRVRDAFDYEVTREGMVYLAAVLVIGIAALNTGNNLLFIVVSAMLAAVIVSGIASAAMLRGLELEVSIPDHAFAGTTTMARIAVRNGRRYLPSFSVTVLPHAKKRPKRWAWRHSEFGIPLGRPPEQQWFRLPDLAIVRATPKAPEPQIYDTPAYFPYLPAKTARSVDVELRFPRRGRYGQEEFGISTRFPFSFLEKTRRVPLHRELIVYPRVETTEEFLELLPMITGEFESFVRGRGHDLYRIRDYQPQDSARHVDWKATAKSRGLKVREFSREDERKLRIVFDNPAPGCVAPDAYERSVGLAASLAWHFAGEHSELSFAAPAYAGAREVYEFLRYLALVRPTRADSVLEHLAVSDDYNLILTTRPRGSIPTALWACSYFLFME